MSKKVVHVRRSKGGKVHLAEGGQRQDFKFLYLFCRGHAFSIADPDVVITEEEVTCRICLRLWRPEEGEEK